MLPGETQFFGDSFRKGERVHTFSGGFNEMNNAYLELSTDPDICADPEYQEQELKFLKLANLKLRMHFIVAIQNYREKCRGLKVDDRTMYFYDTVFPKMRLPVHPRFRFT